LSYCVIIVARNAEQHISRTVDSILQQSVKPELVTIVDDGSTDETGRILEKYARRISSVKVLTKPDLGYDIRRVPSNINLAWDYNARVGFKTVFFMISGDDCVYPPTYAGVLIRRMEGNARVVIASGRPSAGGNLTGEHSPSGSGRMVTSRFWGNAGGYPSKAGWETWLLYRAAQMGLETRLYDDVHFEHARPRGAQHRFTYWGAAMGGLGYHPLYALGRIGKNALVRSMGVKGSMNLLRGYLLSQVGSDDSFISPFEQSLREFVRREQGRRISGIVRALL
jgi:glycosyltransferase involved in cell wall biosynthesis